MASVKFKEALQPRIQYAALPFRTVDGRVEILLVTSRESRRWIVPKGWPIRGLSGAQSAAREAFEEAGVVGDIGPDALGGFTYEKALPDLRNVTCDVAVYALRVTEELDVWPEAAQRERRWMPWQEAARHVREDHLRELIIRFAGRA
ncbi:MAG: NUDIX hydrolase [Asticcacaulis sp.]|nr:NUDIX hydrolase [Asticcacaulis sp.]